METPNTRSSRRKREAEDSNNRSIEYQEEMSVAWEHDQHIRRAVLAATEDEYIAPPTPTQQPRPISSRFSTSTSSDDIATCPRKRLCRNPRSRPLSLRKSLSSASSTHAVVASSSSATFGEVLPGFPAQGEAPKTQLDILLEQFKLQSSPLKQTVGDSSRVRWRGKEQENEPGKGNRSGTETSRRIRGSKEVTAGKAKAEAEGSSRQGHRSHGSRSSSGIRGASSSSVASASTSVTDISNSCTSTSNENPKQSTSFPSLRYPLSPVKPGMPLRIGQGSPNSSSKTLAPSRVSSSKPFKTPFLEPKQGLRSSPRRLGTVAPPHTSSLRAASPSKHFARSTTTVHSTTAIVQPHIIAPNTATAIHPSGFANYDVGENDPEGDTSFDSFDGIFNQGGPEVEMLLRQVDGTQ